MRFSFKISIFNSIKYGLIQSNATILEKYNWVVKIGQVIKGLQKCLQANCSW